MPLCAVKKIIKSMYARGKISKKIIRRGNIRGNSLVSEILMDLLMRSSTLIFVWNKSQLDIETKNLKHVVIYDYGHLHMNKIFL